MSRKRGHNIRNILSGAVVFILCLSMLNIGVLSTELDSEKSNIKIQNLSIPLKPISQNFKNPLDDSKSILDVDTILAATADKELMPSIDIINDNLVAVYSRQPSFIEGPIEVTISQDNGDTWNPAATLNPDGFSINPSISSMEYENMAVCTYEDPEYPGGNPFWSFVDISDTSTWGGYIQDWSDYGFYDFREHKITGYYDSDDEIMENFWGMEALIGSTTYGADQGWDGEEVPMLYYSTDPWNPGYVQISWYSDYEGVEHPSCDSDYNRGWLYAAWDWFNSSIGNREILIAAGPADTFGADEDGKIFSIIPGDILTGLSYPSITSELGHQYLICQINKNNQGEDLVCYHSTDNFETYDVNTIVDTSEDELYPSAVSYGTGVSCTFIKNGDLFITHSADYGSTWSEPEQVNDEAETVLQGYRASEIAKGGNTVWVDTRNDENGDIYFENVGFPPVAVIDITDISGGFGVKANIENIGTAAGENIEWSITFDGPVFIGNSKEGTISSISVGGSETIKTGFIFGFGKSTITITVGGASETAEGVVLGPFVIGL